MTKIIYISGIEDETLSKDSSPDDDDEMNEGEDFFSRNKLMRKMSKNDEEKFPMIVADSIRCQFYYTSRFEKCNGCSLAVDGCEKVFYMSAG